MPIDEAHTDTVRAIDRRVLRLGLGVAFAFVAGVGIGWPISFIGAIFANLLLQAPAPVPVRAVAGLLLRASLAMAAVWYGAQVLMAYPVFFLVALPLAIFAIFRFAAGGGNPLLVVLLVISVLLIPSLLVTSPALAGVGAFWLVANIAIAVAISRIMFALLPPGDEAVAKKPKKPVPTPSEATAHALKMTIITAPYAVLHFALGWDSVLTLIFVALLATSLSGAASAAIGRMLLIANVAGGLVAILSYELLVMATNFAFLSLYVLALVLYFARTMMTGGKYAPYAGSALNSVFVLLGGAMVPFGDDVEVDFIVRIFSIAMAVLYIAIAFSLLERRKRRAAGGAGAPAPSGGG